MDVKQVSRIPTTTVEVETDTAKTIVKLLEQLDDHDDVQSVSSNVSLTDAQLESMAS
jgi:transcriptional/translational regulatory protein YebC/TACO1